jgi:hypothetical protein
MATRLLRGGLLSFPKELAKVVEKLRANIMNNKTVYYTH